MQKYFYKFSLLLSLFIIPNVGQGDALNDCMRAVSNEPAFQNAMTNEIFTGTNELTQEIVTLNKQKIFGAIGATMIMHCPNELPRLTRVANGKVWWEKGGNTYAFQFKMEDLFSYMDIPVGIWVYNDKTLKPGDTINLSDISGKYWSKSCADHLTIDGIDDGTAVNQAAQQTMTGYAKQGNEFFLDFEETDDISSGRRAFPGLVIMDHGGSTNESVVAYSNLHTAIHSAENFANKMTGSACAHDGMAVYVVSLDVRPTDRNGTDQIFGWAAGITGGAMTVVGGLKVAGVIATAGLLGNPVTWVVAGVAAAGAAATALLWTEQLADLERIVILDGPYIVKQ